MSMRRSDGSNGVWVIRGSLGETHDATLCTVAYSGIEKN